MITLYIKTHNITGLKYFGKTIRDDVHKYKGSGQYWKRHISKYGYDVTTEIYEQSTDENYIREKAIQFSLDNNIVESDEWANMIVEDISGARCFGHINGMFGKTHSDDNKKQQSERAKDMMAVVDNNKNVLYVSKYDERVIKGELVPESRGRKLSESTKLKMSKNRQGSDNPKAKCIIICDNDDNIIHECNGNFQKVIKDFNLPKNALNNSLKDSSRLYMTEKSLKNAKFYGYEQYKGWYAKYK